MSRAKSLSPSNRRWAHVALTYDGPSNNIGISWTNGYVGGTHTMPVTLNTFTNTVQMSRRTVNGLNYFPGYLDNVRFYTGRLTQVRSRVLGWDGMVLVARPFLLLIFSARNHRRYVGDRNALRARDPVLRRDPQPCRRLSGPGEQVRKRQGNSQERRYCHGRRR